MKHELPHAKKSLGQHWLTDERILAAIANEAAVSADDHVIEIGPGTGTLTRALVSRGARVTAIEFDAALADALKSTLPEVEVVNEDILRFNFSAVEGAYKIVANIPYYLTSKLIRVISEASNRPDIAVLLVQKEVAERAAAQPGGMSLLSISAQYYWDVSLGVKVSAQFFTPPPKVDSQTLILERRKEPLFGDIDEKEFFRVVKAGFANRRKTLLNSLSGGLHLDKDGVKELLRTAGVKESARPQELSLSNWHRLYQAQNSLKK